MTGDPTLSTGGQITPGFLPAAALGHMEPTAVGTIDLDCHDGVSFRAGPGTMHRDALLLVRLHQEPIGIVHVPDARNAISADKIRALVEHQFGARIRQHEAGFGCRVSDAACPGQAPTHVPGQVAVIVATTGRVDALDRCLRSLTALQRDDLELIVVDNRPARRTYELVSRWQARDRRVHYIAEHRPGLSIARNRGIAATHAQFIAFTDDDVVVEPNWLTWLLAPFADANVGVVTGMVLPGELETAAQKRFEQYSGFCKGFERRAYDVRSNGAYDRLLYPYWGGIFGSGNSVAFRRTELVAMGGFDPALGAGTIVHGGEDLDAMSRAILRGSELVYEPRSLCWHEHRRDDAALRGQLFGYGVGLTGALTKALTHDPRFARAAVRSVPVAFRIHRRRKRRRSSGAALPPEFAKIERAGMLRGPLLYARSARSVHRLRLNEVINGG